MFLDVEQASKTDLNNHTRNTNNPHNVTKKSSRLVKMWIT